MIAMEKTQDSPNLSGIKYHYEIRLIAKYLALIVLGLGLPEFPFKKAAVPTTKDASIR